jgi:superfamily II DNA or RNA helicase
MAEEAFDCKSLNTLIYATPHKNIKQAVGRILREEKKKRVFIPLIIDVQDIFSTFNGWNKIREKYYKGEGYPMKIFEVLVKSKSDVPQINFIKDVSSTKSSFLQKQDLKNPARKTREKNIKKTKKEEDEDEDLDEEEDEEEVIETEEIEF